MEQNCERVCICNSGQNTDLCHLNSSPAKIAPKGDFFHFLKIFKKKLNLSLATVKSKWHWGFYVENAPGHFTGAICLQLQLGMKSAAKNAHPGGPFDFSTLWWQHLCSDSRIRRQPGHVPLFCRSKSAISSRHKSGHGRNKKTPLVAGPLAGTGP